MTPKDRETAIKKARERARECMKLYGSWSLGTHLALQDTFGLREESAFRAATGLHGGMGKGDVCGSLMGANLMMGLVFGDDVKDAEKSKEDFKPGVLDTPTRLVGEIYDWFGKEFTSVKCQDIRDKHEKEVDAEPDAKGLTEEERLDRMISRCEELCCKTAASAAEIIFDEMAKSEVQG